jgi:cell division septation protein DedD
MRIRPPFAVAVLLAVASFAAGCGGSSSTSVTPLGPGPSSVSTTIPLASANQAVALPGLQGFASTITLPSNDAPAGSALEIDESLTLPFGIAPFASSRVPDDRRPSADIPSGAAPVFYFSFLSPITVKLQSVPSFRLTLPQPEPGASYGVALYMPSGGWNVIGSAVVSGSTLTFTGTTAPLTFLAGQRYSLLIYRLPAATPTPVPTSSPTAVPTASPTAKPSASPTPTSAPTATPTPAPTASPTTAPTATPKPTASPTLAPTPTPAPTATPAPTPTPLPSLVFSANALQFNSPGQSQNFTLVTGPGTCCATYTATSSDTNVVTVAQTGNGTWTATSTGVGSATLTMSTPGYQPYTIGVNVAQLILVPQSRGGHR